MFENRKYIIFSVDEIDKIDFNTIQETSVDTLRKSVDGTKTFIKWDEVPFDPTPYESINNETGETFLLTPEPPPEFPLLSLLDSYEGPYTHAEIIDILATDEWSEIKEV